MIYDIFTSPDDGDLCRFNKFSLVKEEFLSGKFFGSDPMPLKKWMLYFLMPSNDEITMLELSELLDRIVRLPTSPKLVWGCASDDKITHYEVFLIKTH